MWGKSFINFLLTLFIGLMAFTSLAQSTTALVLYAKPTPREDNLLVDVYFNLADNGQINTQMDVEAAEIQLENGELYQADVIQPQTPIYIALVLDASGSMLPAGAAMRSAAIQAIDTAPDQAQFAVVRFNNSVDVLQGFTADKGRTKANIEQVQPVNNTGTCLYDAVHDALQLMQTQPLGRRAIILFTDGVDENSSGNGPCSSRGSLASILETATKEDYRIPIYTIGLEGSNAQINRNELMRIATETLGKEGFGGQSSLPDLFRNVMDILNSQWLAQATMYPSAGEQTARLTPIFDNNVRGSVSEPFKFKSDRDYVPPFSLFVSNLSYDEARGQYSFELNGRGVERAASLQVHVINADTNIQIPVPELQNPVFPASENRLTLTFAETPLEAEQKYFLRLNGFSANGLPLLQEPVDLEFMHKPAKPEEQIPVQVQITGMTFNENNKTLQVDLSILGNQQVSRVDFTIVDMETQLDIAETRGSSTGAPTFVQIPIGNLNPGMNYRVEVRPFNLAGQPALAEPTVREFKTEAKPLFLKIEAVAHQPGTTPVTVDLAYENVDLVQAVQYWLQLKDNGVRIMEPVTLEGVPESFALPVENMESEKTYILSVLPIGFDNQPLFADPLLSEFKYMPPARSFFATIGNFVMQPIVLGVVLATFLLACGVMFQRVRASGRQDSNDASSYLPRAGSITILQEVGENTNNTTSTEVVRAKKDTGPLAATQQPAKTSVFPGLRRGETKDERPTAILRVVKSETYKKDKKFDVRDVDFIIGRGGQGKVNFNDDLRVSSQHLRLRYDSKLKAFTAEDNSVNGTTIDGTELRSGQKMILPNGKSVQIILGKAVELVYFMQGSN